MVPVELDQKIASLRHPAGLLDKEGTLITTNQAWCNGLVNGNGLLALVKPGANYRAICREMAAQGYGIAQEMCTRMEKLMGDGRGHFQLSYRHLGGGLACDYEISVSFVTASDNTFVLLEHCRI